MIIPLESNLWYFKVGTCVNPPLDLSLSDKDQELQTPRVHHSSDHPNHFNLSRPQMV